MINVMVSKKAAKLGVSAEAGLVVLAKEHGIGTGPSRYRWLSLSPRRARPPATTRAIQLTHIGIDQSPMMTDQSITIRARWASATMAKITPATRENVFASMSRHPKFRTQDSTPRGGGCERGANDLVTKMVTNGSPRTGIERHELARPATFPNTNQHLRG